MTSSIIRPRGKTVTAIKIGAQVTPNEENAAAISAALFGEDSPLFVRGGRLTINATVLTDLKDVEKMTEAAARVAEIKAQIETLGEVHAFSTVAGRVPEEMVR